MHSDTTLGQEREGTSPLLLATLATTVAVFVWTYWPVIPPLVLQWWDEEEYSHGFIVPIIAGVLVWLNKDALRQVPVRPAYAGLLVMGLSLAIYAVGIVGVDLFLQRVSMVSMIAGALLYVAGWRVLWCLAFPLAYLLLMIPLPQVVFNPVAFRLQLLAAQVATDTLQLLDVPVYREGNIIHLAQVSLDVERACSGIRSLISLLAIGIPLAYVIEQKTWTRALIMVMVVPIAIAANVARVTVTGILAHYVSIETALGVFHTVGGFAVFMLGATLLLLFSWVVKQAARFA
jgi:exosortase